MDSGDEPRNDNIFCMCLKYFPVFFGQTLRLVSSICPPVFTHLIYFFFVIYFIIVVLFLNSFNLCFYIMNIDNYFF